jgi:hypothetical protein
MARRHRRSSKVQTAEKTWVFDLSEDGESVVNRIKYLDCAQVHSLVNRVSARQGYEYVVQSIEIGCQSGGAFSAAIYRLPEHWACINAWEKTMRIWKEQQDDVMAEAGLESTIGRYRDFKIHFDAGHVTAGFSANLIPNGFAITDAAGTNESYEWFTSEVVIPNDGAPGNTTERKLHMLGGDNGSNSSGMIKAYAESRARPQQTDPNIVDVPTGGLFGLMRDVGDDDNVIVTNTQDANDVPPYLLGLDGAEEYYPGGGFQGIGPFDASGIQHPGTLIDVLSVNSSQNYNTDTCPGFVAPCGLIKIEYRATGVLPASPALLNYQPAFWMKVVMAPGHYKGLLAQSMQEAN